MKMEDLFQAYYDARKNKRNTINALAFEYNYESELFQLYEEIKEKTYSPGTSICFINEYPVKREVFAADFRDRVVHHLIYNYIYFIFERLFIYDAYSCRLGKGTLKGINRLNHFIHSCSQNYKTDCYVLKLDIKGYFMNIDKVLLYHKIENVLAKYRDHIEIQDIELRDLLFLIRKIVFDDPTKNCHIKGSSEDWRGLPRDKSLFYSGKNKGIPIGNLTSQLFSNVYLNDLDHYMKHTLGCLYYGRYVDDFFIVSQDKTFLKRTVFLIDGFLSENMGLRLHPKKVYLQHFSKGVNFLGAHIKPYRVYIQNKTKGNLYKKIYKWNKFWKERDYKLTTKEIHQFISEVNSYLGMMRHLHSKKLRETAIEKIDILIFNHVYVDSIRNNFLVVRDC